MVSKQHRVQVLLGGLAVVMVVAVFAFSFSLSNAYHVHAQAAIDGFNHPGNVLISDQFNNRVIEVNRDKQIVWTFGSGNPTLCNPGLGAVIAPNDAERLAGGLTLIPGTGAAAGAGGFKQNCPDNRVIVVNQGGRIVWQYGTIGISSPLNTPVFAIQLPNHNILIVDQGNNRVIEVDRNSKKIVWSYGPTSGPGALNSPNSAELLPNGHILIADENNNRVIEITRSGNIVWQVGKALGLNVVAFASRLPDGTTLIADSGNNRVIKVSPDKQLVFQYFTNKGAGSNPNPNPTGAVQLANGDISIADQFNNRAIIIGPNKSIKFQYGMTNVIGSGQDQLYAPYSAVVIGDYTGQTPPPSTF
ncbi:MAG TPA: PQQ-binding-like beta-propeller repeat protein [Ktedonobacteraceae bacterium]|nr:PQQ-binding-like beta-propeller repeat protein [Ktedonobacteraceae bacterium]